MRHWMSMTLLCLTLPALADSPTTYNSSPEDHSCSEKFTAGQYLDALISCQQAALRGSKYAQSTLGIMYYFGHGVIADNSKAAQWFQKAANQQDAKAQYYLGRMYSIGLGVPQDDILGTKWLRASAEQGYWEAQWMLSLAYRLGIGIPKDMEASYIWYQAAIKNGLKNAPEKSKQDFTLSYYDEDPSHPGHHAYRMGLDALMGVEGAPNPHQAISWFRQAADMNHPDAEFKLGVLYFEGEGTEQNYSESYTWFTKAAEQDHRDAQAHLAWMTQLGVGTPMDPQGALDLFVKSLELTQKEQVKKEERQVVPDSFEWYEIAARKGDPKAQTIVGMKYLTGDGTRVDYRRGFLWLERAATLKYPPAQHQLGLLYLEGKGVIQAPKAGLYWLNQAAIANNPDAQFELGLQYLVGKYIPQNFKQAYAWFNLAVGQDLVEARAAKNIVMDKMSKQELEEAQLLSRELYNKINTPERVKTP